MEVHMVENKYMKQTEKRCPFDKTEYQKYCSIWEHINDKNIECVYKFECEGIKNDLICQCKRNKKSC